jgi:hypothetical protein
MLAAIAVFTDRQNQLVAGEGVEIIASEAAAELMTQGAVDEIAALTSLLGAIGEFAGGSEGRSGTFALVKLDELDGF